MAVYCKIPDCGRPVEGRTEYCASHNFERRKADRTTVKEKKPIKKVSTKRAAENQVYARLRKDYLEVFMVCEVVECHRKATQIHHIKGREGDLFCDVNNFLAVCDVCHQRITIDSAWAISQGYSILRSV